MDIERNKIVIFESDLINLIRSELVKDEYTKSVNLLIGKENDEVIRTICDVFDGHEFNIRISLEEIFELIKRAYSNYDKDVKDIIYHNKSYGSSYEIFYDVKVMVYGK